MDAPLSNLVDTNNTVAEFETGNRPPAPQTITGIPMAERAEQALEKLAAFSPVQAADGVSRNSHTGETMPHGIAALQEFLRTNPHRDTSDESRAAHLTASRAAAQKVGFSEQIQEQQTGLIALGFDLGQTYADGLLGKRTRQALVEFELLYAPVIDLQHELDGGDLTAVIKAFAELARQDREKFAIEGEVVAAIRLASLRTGVNFSYLMELAAAESSFDSMTETLKSSARGLFQFTEDTWLASIKAFGEKYGLGIYVDQIEYFVDYAGKMRAIIANPIVHQQLLELRTNPRYAALMAAELTKSNETKLKNALRRNVGRTELYLSHFFGMTDALRFIKALDDNPRRIAGDIFPHAALSNPGVFFPIPGRPNTVSEVYAFFDQKFNLGLYENPSPLFMLVEKISDKRKAGPGS